MESVPWITGGLGALVLLASLVCVYLEQRALPIAAGFAKLSASAGFLALAAVVEVLDGPLAWALALCFIGDAALIGRSRSAFLAGLVAFLLGHLAYVQAFVDRGLDLGWLAVAAAVVFPIGFAFEAWLASRVSELRPAVIAYVGVVSAMVVAAASTSGFVPSPLLLSGAVAFWLSDVMVALRRFVTDAAWVRWVGLPLYYLGQLLLIAGFAAGS